MPQASTPATVADLTPENVSSGLGKLRKMLAVASDPGNANATAYHRGMANGLILAMSCFTGEECKFIDPDAKEIAEAEALRNLAGK